VFSLITWSLFPGQRPILCVYNRMTTPQNQSGREQQSTVTLSVATLAEQTRFLKYVLQDKVVSPFCTSCNVHETVNNMISWKFCFYCRFTDIWDGKVVELLESRLKQSQIWVRSACNRVSLCHSVKSTLLWEYQLGG
jgi:hypothetical protein